MKALRYLLFVVAIVLVLSSVIAAPSSATQAQANNVQRVLAQQAIKRLTATSTPAG